MLFYPMTPSVPGTDYLLTLDVPYGSHGEELADEFIQDMLARLVNDYMVAPTYLFVSQEDHRTLIRMVRMDETLLRYRVRYDDPILLGEVYPNKVTGRHLKIVVFPDLPEKTIRLGGYYKQYGEIVREF